MSYLHRKFSQFVKCVPNLIEIAPCVHNYGVTLTLIYIFFSYNPALYPEDRRAVKLMFIVCI